jgi:hypothetical protein
MKVTITQDFDSVEDAADFLARVLGTAAQQPEQVINIVPPATFTAEAVAAHTAAVTAGAKVRKPRADAGKPRGPHKDKDAAPAAPAAQAQEAQRAEPVPPPAPATPPQAPAKVDAAPPVSPTAGVTLEDARAEMKRLNDTKGKGMDACIATLKAFGVNRISDLPKEKIGDFIKDVQAQIEAQTRSNALAKAAAK